MGTKVGFRRGAQANLPATGAQGTFYLTNDTNRLYFAQADNQPLVLLNQTVQIVQNISDLTNISNNWGTTAAAAHINDFYYIAGNGVNGENSNILVVWTGTQWRQINADHNTFIESVTATVSSSTNLANVHTSLTNNESNSLTATFSIQGAGSVVAGTTGDTVLITGKEYSLVNKIDTSAGASTEIYLAVDGATANASKVILKAADNSPITIQGTSAGVVIDSNNTYNMSAGLAIPTDGSLAFSILDSDSNSVTATLNNVGIMLNDGSYVPLKSTTGNAGAIYSAAEIDAKIKGLDGMTYKGTLGSSSDGATVTALPSSGIKNGDTYVIVTNAAANDSMFSGYNFNTATIPSTGVIVGDMIIASGTEGTDGFIPSANVEWTYVPSGNDSLAVVTYSSTVATATHSIELHNETPATIFGHKLEAGTDVVLSSVTYTPTNGAANSGLVTTISHAAITTTSTTAATVSDGVASFTAIKGITVDNGHVTAIETDVFTPVTYDLNDAVVVNGTRVGSNNAGANDVTATIELVDSNTNVVGSADLMISSSSLIVSKGSSTTSNEVIVDFEWGTF